MIPGPYGGINMNAVDPPQDRRRCSIRKRARTLLRRTSLFAALFVVLLSSFLGIPSTTKAKTAAILHDSSFSPGCNQEALSVTLGIAVYHVVGWLCYSGAITQYDYVQVLVSGGTYDHTYWDFPTVNGIDYSYVHAMNAAGYATFNLDRLGYGLSAHPLPELLTVQASVGVIHQIILALKAGLVGAHVFRHVILVGHSIGSAIVVAEASSYGDVNGVLLSGFLHFVDPAFATQLATDVYPADLDPHFSTSGLPPGYLTTRPGTRGQLFYYLPDADPQVVEMDEATKSTMTDSEVATFFSVESTPLYSIGIHVPVFIAVGQEDNIFCLGTLDCHNSAGVQAYESLFWAPQAHLQVHVIPSAGHDLNLQENVSAWYSLAIQWMEGTFPGAQALSPSFP